MTAMHDVTYLYERKTDRRKATFVICQDCFWCVSCFKVDRELQYCHACRSGNIDSLPVFADEFFNLNIDRGNVELAFDSRR